MTPIQLIAALVQSLLFTFHLRSWRFTGDTVTFGVGAGTVVGSIVLLGLVLPS